MKGQEQVDVSSHFKHENEAGSPGYYAVFLEKHKIQAEMTVTQRNSLFKFTFPKMLRKAYRFQTLNPLRL